MAFVKGKGLIWPEYWIDCSECDHHQPLATKSQPSKSARQQGWRRTSGGRWLCPQCVEHAEEVRQINAERASA